MTRGIALIRLLRYVWCHPLNAHARLSALGRVMRWQVASRLMGDMIAFPFVDETRLCAKRGMTGATGNWYCGLHEYREMAFVLHLLRAGDHFVDVGANVGSYTVLAAGGTGARVTAFEPIAPSFGHLERNVALNGLHSRVRCLQVGASDRSGKLPFSTGLDTVNHVLAPGEDVPAADIPVERVDDVLGDDTPVLIKIDVEGHEVAVVRGASRILSRSDVAAVIMETNGSGSRYGITDDVLLTAMREMDFLPFRYDPFKRALTPGSEANGNTIFVRDRDFVEARVKSAPLHRLVNRQI